MKFLILVALVFCSCSQTTVHLYARYLSDSQIQAINKKLVAADFAVKPNHLKFPQSITQSSITYSPLINDRNAVNKLINSMHGMGWEIHNISMLVTDNHWYKDNSIALMLVPPNVDTRAQINQQDWVNEYNSQNCAQSLSINLLRSGQYQILTEHNQLLQHEVATGKWAINNFPYLELRSKNADWQFYFELKHYVNTDKIGEIQISELSPMSHYTVFSSCTFVYGIRK